MADRGAFENRGPSVLAVTIVLLAISTAAVVLRLISRIGVVKHVYKDDYFIVLAWLIALGFSISICIGTSVGLGRHELNLKPEWIKPLKKSEYAFSVLYNPALMATKTSIGLFYLTIASNQAIFKWTTIATLVVVNVAGTALTFLNIFQCRPIGAAFYQDIPGGAHCMDIVTLYLSSAPVNIITDMALLLLPLPILTAMRLPRNEKIILIITFSFGWFVAVVDVVRIAYLQSASLARLQGDIAASRNRGDFSWVASLSFMWSAVEVHIGIIVACVPGLKPLASRVFPNLLGKIKSVADRTTSSFYSHDGVHWMHHRRHDPENSAPSSPIKEKRDSPASSQQDDAPADLIRNPAAAMHHTDHTASGDLGLMDFLNSDDAKGPPTRMNTASTADTRLNRSNSITPYDFVDIKNSKSIITRSTKESMYPIAIVTVLFFLWGFAYGLLDVLNSQFQLIVGVSNGQAIALHSAYYGAYLIAPLTFGRIVFKKLGFKATFVVGLCIYGCGTIIFWPSAVLGSFPAFLISNLIVGLGIATLELAGNPYISLCGPPQYAEVRLNISQAVQAIGTVVSPLLAKHVMFKSVNDAPSLIDVQWTYLGITLFVIILALIFFYLPIPEVSDDELQYMADQRASINDQQLLGGKVIWLTLGLGALSQFCYVGGQEAVAGTFQTFVATVKPDSRVSPFNYQSVGHTVFAAGRFVSAIAGLCIKPRHILLGLYIGCVVTAVLAMNLTGDAGVAMVVLIYLFESGIFSIIYAMCLRGLGKHTKDGAILITAATAGGAIIPPILSAVSDHRGLRYSYCVIVAVFAFGAILPIYTTTVRPAKRQVDPYCDVKSEKRPRTPMNGRSGLTKRKTGKASSPSHHVSNMETPDMNDEKWPSVLN